MYLIIKEAKYPGGRRPSPPPEADKVESENTKSYLWELFFHHAKANSNRAG
jgi:hypothetical protein